MPVPGAKPLHGGELGLVALKADAPGAFHIRRIGAYALPVASGVGHQLARFHGAHGAVGGLDLGRVDPIVGRRAALPFGIAKEAVRYGLFKPALDRPIFRQHGLQRP